MCCRRFYCAVETALDCFERFDWSPLCGPQALRRGDTLKRQPPQGFSVVLSRGHTPLNLTESSLSMVLPNRSTSFRAYGFVEDKAETETVFSESERTGIQKFLRKYCGVDLKTYREFWGASILCMSNPILWDYKSFGVDAEGRLCLLLLPRDGQDVTGLRYMVHTQHLFGPVTTNVSKVTSEVLRFPLPNPDLDPHLYLWDKHGNLLEVRLLSLAPSSTPPGGGAHFPIARVRRSGRRTIMSPAKREKTCCYSRRKRACTRAWRKEASSSISNPEIPRGPATRWESSSPRRDLT